MSEPNTPAEEAAQPSTEAAGSSSEQAAPKRAIWAGDPPAQPVANQEGSSADREQAPKSDRKVEPAPKALDPELESQIESRVQKALAKERESAKKAQAAQQRQAEAEVAERTLNEIRALARAAKKGGPEGLEAAEKLVQKQIELHGADEPAGSPDTLRATLIQEITAAKWHEHAEAFGVDPQDEDFAQVPAEARLKGLNAVIVRKTTDKTLVEAMAQNGAVKQHFAQQYAKEIEAARNDGMAKGSAPKLDVGGANSGKPLSDAELDRAYFNDRKNPQLAKLWITKERRLGRM